MYGGGVLFRLNQLRLQPLYLLLLCGGGYEIVGLTPAALLGGEGFFRFSAFAKEGDVDKALSRLDKIL